MAFPRILLGMAAVAAFFLLWREIERRIRRAPEPAPGGFTAALPPIAAEAILLGLFAGLWFGSLGSGGAVLLFLVVGALMELPGALRRRQAAGFSFVAVGSAVARIVLAGLILAWILG